mmetsp:Transcript_15972/g.19186  ORF Transcript_15972/g.19186 Transcript_15972/m.19186 type:complete len:233 (+) Transcript_15972:95-793(+)
MSASLPQGSDDYRHSSSKPSISLNAETIRVYISAVVMRVRERVTIDTIRPLPMFLGLSGPAFCVSAGAFTPPTRHMDRTAPEKIRSRIRLNFAFFLSNYALLTCGVAIVVALLHPGMLIFLGLLWGLWSLHEFMISNELIVFGKNISSGMSIPQRSLLLSALSAFVIIWKCLAPFVVVVVVSSLMIVSHSIMRDPKHIESSNEFRRRGAADSDEEGGASDDSGELVERGDVI